MSRVVLLTGAAGGIVGAVTAVIGILWSFIAYIFLTEINNYLTQLGTYFTSLIPGSLVAGIPIPLPYPYYPSASLFSVYSFIIAAFLIMTGILTGVGFYGTYKIGGGSMGLAGLASGVIGITLGALLIIMRNLTTGYMKAPVAVSEVTYPAVPVPTPNFPLIWIGFIVLGVTFIVLGAASRSVRETTEKPSAFNAAGIMSIIGAIAFIIGGLMGIIANYIIVAIIGFGLVLVAFILWALIFIISEGKT